MDSRTITATTGNGEFKKVDRTLIRLERIGGENVCANVDGENQDEIFEMLGDCIAEQLYKHPKYRKQMKKMFRHMIRNTPMWFDTPANGWFATLLCTFAAIGFIWFSANLIHGIWTIFMRFIGVA